MKRLHVHVVVPPSQPAYAVPEPTYVSPPAATAQISGETDQVYRDLSRADANSAYGA